MHDLDYYKKMKDGKCDIDSIGGEIEGHLYEIKRLQKEMSGLPDQVDEKKADSLLRRPPTRLLTLLSRRHEAVLLGQGIHGAHRGDPPGGYPAIHILAI